MKFRRAPAEEAEINLIPFIDVLLVVLIFLMLSTTYSKFTELQVSLPTADAEAIKERPKEILVAVSADGRYSINGQSIDGRSVELLAAALREAGQSQTDAFIVISADASAAHQSVINVLDGARRAGLSRITFAAQVPQGGNADRRAP
ncbi:ExbD/TolR family protein [Ideonella sp.]|uniref:ExbD/TolR family protein n=1 Tax=Ideonella sp. TaxID=1929293 RepID=UPI003BB7BCF1